MGYKLKTVTLSLTLAAGFALGAGITRAMTPSTPEPVVRYMAGTPDPARYVDLRNKDDRSGLIRLCLKTIDASPTKNTDEPLCGRAIDAMKEYGL